MKTTRPWTLLGYALAVGVLSFGVAGVMDTYGRMFSVPASAPSALGAFALIVLSLALTLRARLRALHERRPHARPVDPLMAARAAMLARASGLAGALAGGFYLGYGVYLLRDLDIAVLRQRALMCGLCVLAALCLVLAGYFLERICRLPKPPQHTEKPTSVGAGHEDY